MTYPVVNNYTLSSDWPKRKLTPDLQATFEEQDKVLQRMIRDVQVFTDLADPDKIAAELLPIYLLVRGMWLPKDLPGIELTEAQTRKLGRLLIPIYRQKGTEKGIENIARVLLGLEVRVYRLFNLTRWRLGKPGFTELGVSTILGDGASYDGAPAFWFEVRTEDAITDTQRQNLLVLIEYMKPIYMQLIRIIEPPPAVSHWSLNRSRLGTQTTLHSPSEE